MESAPLSRALELSGELSSCLLTAILREDSKCEVETDMTEWSKWSHLFWRSRRPVCIEKYSFPMEVASMLSTRTISISPRATIDWRSSIELDWIVTLNDCIEVANAVFGSDWTNLGVRFRELQLPNKWTIPKQKLYKHIQITCFWIN